MTLSLKLGQIFWLIIPHFKEKLKPRPFLVYDITGEDYVFLKITGSDRSSDERKGIHYVPQYHLVHKPSNLYKVSFVDLNTLIYIEHGLFFELLHRALEAKQGQLILQEDFNKIIKGIEICFGSKIFRGNRYKIRVA